MQSCVYSSPHLDSESVQLELYLDLRVVESSQVPSLSSAIPPPCGAGHPSSPLVHLLPHLFPFYFSLSFIGFTYFLLLSIPSLSTRIVPLRFQAGGRRRRPNLGLVCVFLCYLYSLVKMHCGVLFYLVYFCVFLQCFDTVGWVI